MSDATELARALDAISEASGVLHAIAETGMITPAAQQVAAKHSAALVEARRTIEARGVRVAPAAPPRCESRGPDGVVAGQRCVLERGHGGAHVHTPLAPVGEQGAGPTIDEIAVALLAATDPLDGVHPFDVALERHIRKLAPVVHSMLAASRTRAPAATEPPQ